MRASLARPNPANHSFPIICIWLNLTIRRLVTRQLFQWLPQVCEKVARALLSNLSKSIPKVTVLGISKIADGRAFRSGVWSREKLLPNDSVALISVCSVRRLPSGYSTEKLNIEDEKNEREHFQYSNLREFRNKHLAEYRACRLRWRWRWFPDSINHAGSAHNTGCHHRDQRTDGGLGFYQRFRPLYRR